MSIEAMEQALEALEQFKGLTKAKGLSDISDAAITALQAAIAEAEKQEPLGYITRSRSAVSEAQQALPGVSPVWLWSSITFGTKDLERFEGHDDLEVLRLYTHPAPAAPVQRLAAWHDKIIGMEVSMDVSTGEDDIDHRVYGQVYEVMLAYDGGPDVILAIESERNFTTPPAQPAPVQEPGEAIDHIKRALPEFRQQDDYLLSHCASLMSEDSHEIIHIDTALRIAQTTPHAAQRQPLTREQREVVIAKADQAMTADPNLSWRDALISQTEAAHGITGDKE
jgi:hypothetical protein